MCLKLNILGTRHRYTMECESTRERCVLGAGTVDLSVTINREKDSGDLDIIGALCNLSLYRLALYQRCIPVCSNYIKL